jgi:23S rRNA pseudouridine1911/1915/1917 synthase
LSRTPRSPGEPRRRTRHHFPRSRPGAETHVFRCRSRGQRLDQYLATRFTGYSRSFLAGLCREGRVLVGGNRAKPGRRLLPDEEITVILPEGARAGPEEMPIEMLHEDSAVFVVNKPPGMAVHPSRGHLSGTLYHGLLWRFRKELEGDPGFRIGPVHRLDLDTSGVLIYAKDERTQKRLARAIEKRDVVKTYLALVHGELAFEAVVIDGAIGFDEGGKRMAVDGDEARPARTGLHRVAAGGGFSLVRLDLFTGRSHQLRVHLAALGHPVAGDELYGGLRRSETGGPLIGRQALHAWRLELDHPVTGERVGYTAPLPDDMAGLARRLGLEPPS